MAVYAKIINKASTLLYESDVILDLTHGINYLQAMALYALETIRSLYATKVKVYNFSPFPVRAYSLESLFQRISFLLKDLRVSQACQRLT